jgi:iron(III) transport system substrate-binding protein
VYPEDGTFTTPEYIVLAKGAPNGAVAKRAYDHILSKEVQIALLENAFRRPSRADIDVAKHAELPNFASIKVFALNENDAAAKRKEFLDEWTAAVAAKS